MDSPRSGAAEPGATARSPRSWPAQKPRPAPVNTSTRAAAPDSVANACCTSSCIRVLKLLSLSGLFKVRRAMPPSTPNKIVSYAMRILWAARAAPRLLVIVADAERGGGGSCLAAQHETRLDLPGLQGNIVSHGRRPLGDLRAAGGANARTARERQFETRPLRRLEHGGIARRHRKTAPPAIHDHADGGQQFLGGSRSSHDRAGRTGHAERIGRAGRTG